MKIYSINDSEFKPFGRVLKLDTKEIVEAGSKIPMPDNGSIYHASEETFEKLSIRDTVENECFGGLPCQIGYCFGHSNKLNALEWHKCSEINIAVTDCILLLGKVQDIDENNRYNSSKVMAFTVKKGEAIEVYSTTLHFCPIETDKSGFGMVVGLLKDTNTPLEITPDDKLLFRKNKWIIAHEDNTGLIAQGVEPGIYGENYEL